MMGKLLEIELGKILSSKNDKSKQIKSSEYLPNGAFPVVDQSEKFICGYFDDEAKVISKELPMTVFGDHTRHVKFIDFPFICGADGTQLLKPTDGYSDKYLYYIVQRAAGLIGNYGYDRHFKHLKEFKVKVTNEIPEQTRIAEILSTADAAIAQTEALIAKYQLIKTGLMQDLLTRGIDANGSIRSKATHKFVVKNGIEVPEEWEVKELKSFTSYISYGFTNPMPETEEGPYLITALNINQGRILFDTCRKTSQKAFNELLTNKSRPKIGDILITKDGTLGRVALVDRINLCINQSVAVLRPKEDKIRKEYFKTLLESPFYQAKILGDAGGSTIKHIYITKLDKMQIAVPKALAEQDKFLKSLNSQTIVIDQYKEQLSKLRSLKIGLMQDLLSGRKRLNL